MSDADLAYHWSPASRRNAIKRRGLVPGSKSRSGAWRPPFVCLSRDPSYAVASSEAQTPLDEAMDLWMVDLAEVPVSREEFDWHDEVRFYEPIAKDYLTWLGTR